MKNGKFESRFGHTWDVFGTDLQSAFWVILDGFCDPSKWDHTMQTRSYPASHVPFSLQAFRICLRVGLGEHLQETLIICEYALW